MVRALVWILENRSKAVVTMATNVVVKLITVLPNTLLQSYLLDVLHSLLYLLSSQEVESVSCAIALNIILSNLSVRTERDTCGILVKTEAVSHIVRSIKQNSASTVPIEYFQEMAKLLSTILKRWPQSRYPVWNDAVLLEALGVMRARPEFSVKVAVLKLYSALGIIYGMYFLFGKFLSSTSIKVVSDFFLFPASIVQPWGQQASRKWRSPPANDGSLYERILPSFCSGGGI